MTRSGHIRLLAAGALTIAAAVPATFIASEASFAATIPSVSLLTAPSADIALVPADDDTAMTGGDVLLEQAFTADEQTRSSQDFAATDDIDAELECMAKVVVHEAGNQSRAGQLAVAQLIVNRLESGRFADTVCGVVNQPGQFFQTASYNPRRDGDAWRTAVSVSREAREGRTADVAPGAMFFRAAYAAPTSFFRTRTRVVTLGDHVFYR